MSEIERRWIRPDDCDEFRYIDGQMQRRYEDEDHFGATCFTLDNMSEYGYVETFDHLPVEPKPDHTAAKLAAHEQFYRDFRTARATEGRYETERLLANAETSLLRELRRIMGGE
jgi:hypothetical protein